DNAQALFQKTGKGPIKNGSYRYHPRGRKLLQAPHYATNCPIWGQGVDERPWQIRCHGTTGKKFGIRCAIEQEVHQCNTDGPARSTSEIFKIASVASLIW